MGGACRSPLCPMMLRLGVDLRGKDISRWSPNSMTSFCQESKNPIISESFAFSPVPSNSSSFYIFSEFIIIICRRFRWYRPLFHHQNSPDSFLIKWNMNCNKADDKTGKLMDIYTQFVHSGVSLQSSGYILSPYLREHLLIHTRIYVRKLLKPSG